MDWRSSLYRARRIPRRKRGSKGYLKGYKSWVGATKETRGWSHRDDRRRAREAGARAVGKYADALRLLD